MSEQRTEQKTVGTGSNNPVPVANTSSNNLLLAVNVILLLIFIWMIMPRIGIFVQIAITLVPFYLLVHRFSPVIRGTLERTLIAFPLACLWLIPLIFISFVPLFSLGKVAIVVLWFFVPAIIALKFEWKEVGAGLGRFQSSFSSSRRLAFVLLLSIIVAYSFSGLIASAGLPRTDATAFLNRAVFVKNSLADYGQIQDWSSKEQLGYPALTFDPPAYYVYEGTLAYLFGTDTSSLTEEFNVLLFVFILLFAIGMFVLCSELFGNDLYGFVAAAVLVTNPYMTTLSLFVGNIKLFSAYAAVPLALLLSLRYARRDEGSGSIGFMATSALVLGFILMAHFNVFPFALAIFGISALVRLFVKKNLDGVIVPDSGTVISTIKELAIFAAILFAIILFFIIPPVVYKQYTSSVKFSLEPFNAGAFVSNLFGNASSSDYDEKLGLLFGAAFVIAILANVFSIFSARKVEWFHVLFAVILIAFAVLQILGGLNEMFAQMVVSFIRIEYFLLIAMSIVIASLLKITNFDIESGKYGAIGIVAAIVIILVIASSATVTSKRSVSWVTDQFIKSNSANPSPFFANEVTGRITTYGMYATIIHPGLTIAYGLDTNGMGFIPGQHTDIYQQKLNDIYAGWLLPKSTTAEDAYKLYQMTGVTTIWVNVCTPGGSQTVQRFESCVQGVKPTCPLGGKQFSQCDVMLFINSSLAKETGGSKGAFNFASYSETSLADAAYETVSDQKIKFVPQFPSGYILMKQEYFPRWKAVQEGVGQVEVGKSDIGLLVVENRNGKPISLNYEFELWEKLLLFVSVVGVASSFAFSVRFHPYF